MMLLRYLQRNLWLHAILAGYALLLALNAAGATVWLPQCLVTSFTGHHCLGCGLNRAAISLLRADLGEAWSNNPFVFLYLAVIGWWLISDYRKYNQP